MPIFENHIKALNSIQNFKCLGIYHCDKLNWRDKYPVDNPIWKIGEKE
jgi:hypothetical protein